MLIAGVVGIVFCDAIAALCCPRGAEEGAGLEGSRASTGDVEARASADWNPKEPLLEDPEGLSGTLQGPNYCRGLLFAVLVGLSGGSILVPMHYVPQDGQGLVFIPSFGIGVVCTAPLVTWAYFLFQGESVMEQELHFRAA